MSKRLSGLIAAPFTPLKPDGSLWLTQIPAYANHLAAQQVAGAFVCGTTGEGSSLTTEERKVIAEHWRAARPSNLKVIVHVGTNCLSDSQELARHAQAIETDAVAAIAPHFFRPATIRDLVEWCADIASAAPGLPFYYYHMPSMTGVNLPMAEFLPMAADRIPTFRGIKFTHENLMDYGMTLAAAGEDFDILFGRDEILLSALVLGAKGAVGSTYNYAAPIYHRVIAAHARGDQDAAVAAQLEATNFISVFSKYNGLSANKAIMRMIGLDCGPIRQPLSQIGADQEAALKRALEEIGFFSAIGAKASIVA